MSTYTDSCCIRLMSQPMWHPHEYQAALACSSCIHLKKSCEFGGTASTNIMRCSATSRGASGRSCLPQHSRRGSARAGGAGQCHAQWPHSRPQSRRRRRQGPSRAVATAGATAATQRLPCSTSEHGSIVTQYQLAVRRPGATLSRCLHVVACPLVRRVAHLAK